MVEGIWNDVRYALRSIRKAPAFAGVVQLVRESIGDGWAELARRIPELA